MSGEGSAGRGRRPVGVPRASGAPGRAAARRALGNWRPSYDAGSDGPRATPERTP